MGRAEPTPKLRPATSTSPGCTSSTQPGRLAEKQCGSCSSSVHMTAKSGMTRSVLMSSPNFQTLPLNVFAIVRFLRSEPARGLADR